jgi:hypothetical protein
MNDLSIGDRVTFTHAARQGRGYSFTTRTAKIIHLSERNVAVKYRGKIINLRPDRVRKEGAETELTQMVMGGELS